MTQKRFIVFIFFVYWRESGILSMINWKLWLIRMKLFALVSKDSNRQMMFYRCFELIDRISRQIEVTRESPCFLIAYFSSGKVRDRFFQWRANHWANWSWMTSMFESRLDSSIVTEWCSFSIDFAVCWKHSKRDLVLTDLPFWFPRAKQSNRFAHSSLRNDFPFLEWIRNHLEDDPTKVNERVALLALQ